jgi:hypothetical protein
VSDTSDWKPHHYPNSRVANKDWSILVSPVGGTEYDGAQLAVLMDIRAELRKLNYLLHCENFTGIPRVLAGIKSNTARPKKRGKKGR